MDKVGTMNGALVWLFALLAVVIGVGGGYATSGISSTVSSGVFFGAFLIAGFGATLLTEAKTFVAVLAFFLGALITGGIYFALASSMMQPAAGSEAGMFGAFIGGFLALIAAIVSMVGGISGCVAGARVRGMMQEAR